MKDLTCINQQTCFKFIASPSVIETVEESIQPIFDFLVFPIFVVKLECLLHKNNAFIMKRSSLIAKNVRFTRPGRVVMVM